MSDSVDVKVVRPYASVEEFLEGDAWTVGRSDMLLVNQPPLPAKTVIRFEIVLASGQTLVRGEGWAGEYLTESNGRPGGLRVRFRRFDNESKSLLRKALERQKRTARAAPAAPAEASLPSPTPAAEPQAAPVEPQEAPVASSADGEKSGVRHRPKTAVRAPADREALLGRLRERSKQLAKTTGDTTSPDRMAV